MALKSFRFKPESREQKEAIEDATPNLLYCGSGGAGKTFTGAAKALLVAADFPRSGVALVRKKEKYLKATLWREFVDKVCPDKIVVKKNDSTLYRRLRNGSEIFGVGLDSSSSGVNVLASREFSLVVIEEATELTEEDFDEKIDRVMRRRGTGFVQVMMLCNPGAPAHFLHRRFYLKQVPFKDDYRKISGKTLPPPFFPDSYYRRLKGLKGVFGKRYRDGIWCGAEGLVYPFDPGKHVIPRFIIPCDWARVVSVDFGFALDHPFVCLWHAISNSSFRIGDKVYPAGSWFLYRQIYMTQRLVEDHARKICGYNAQDHIITPAICDHDAEDRATLNKYGVKTTPARKDRLLGQRAMYQLMADDNYFILEDSLEEIDQDLLMAKLPTCMEEEFPVFTWSTKAKEDMIDYNDHAMSAARYAIFTKLKRSGPIQYNQPGVATRNTEARR